MLDSRAQRLSLSCRDAEAAAKGQAHNSDLANLVERTRATQAQLDRARTLLSAVSDPVAIKGKGALKQIRSVRSRLAKEDDLQKYTSSKPFLNGVKAVTTLGNSAETVAQHAWQAWIASQTPVEIRDESPIPEVPGNRSLVIRLRSMSHSIRTYATKSPVREWDGGASPSERMSEFQELVESWNKDWHSLKQVVDEYPPVVRDFLANVASENGVILTDLLPEVWGWLQKNSMTDSYVVVEHGRHD